MRIRREGSFISCAVREALVPAVAIPCAVREALVPAVRARNICAIQLWHNKPIPSVRACRRTGPARFFLFRHSLICASVRKYLRFMYYLAYRKCRIVLFSIRHVGTD